MLDSLTIVGTGALGCLFAARLAQADVQVTLLGTWSEGLEALRRHGVRLVEANGHEESFRVRSTADPGDCAGTRFALVLVKSWQTQRAAGQLAQCLAEDGVALTLQNGLGNREALVQALGVPRVAQGVTTTGATLVGPGRVRPGGEGTISLGAHPRMEPLADLFRRVGFAVDTVPDADDLLWSKVVINAAINPLTALLRVPNGELLARPAARTLLAASARETAAVANALGRDLAYQDPVAAVEEVARRTAANRSSMLQDVERGAPTEIDAICGAIAQVGEQSGVAAPVNWTLWLLVRALVEGQGGG